MYKPNGINKLKLNIGQASVKHAECTNPMKEIMCAWLLKCRKTRALARVVTFLCAHTVSGCSDYALLLFRMTSRVQCTVP